MVHRRGDSLRVLAVMAHPDDAEFLCAGTLALLKENGWEVVIATLSPGDCGSADLPALEIIRLRREEALQSVKLLSGEYYCLEEGDLAIDYDTRTRRKVVSLVRKVNPTLVFTHSLTDYMADHEITARLVRDACFGASMVNYGGANMDPPIKALPFLYYCDPIEGIDYYGQRVLAPMVVNIERTLAVKRAMLECHKSQREWLRRQHGVDEYIEAMIRWSQERGREAGFAYGEGFWQHRGHAFPKENLLKEILGDKVKEIPYPKIGGGVGEQ